jgi:hypothetical protein
VLWTFPAAAQPTLDGDVTFATRYVFRGEVMSSRWNLQPRAWFNAGTPLGSLSLGGWGLIEPTHPRPRDFSLRGADGSPLAELDLWTQLSWKVLGQQLTTGVTRYQVVNDSLPAISSSPYAEAFITAERAFDTPITEAAWYRARYWHGFAGAGSRYAELSLGNQWLLAPLNDISAAITGTAGINLANSDVRARQPGAFVKRGVTHYELALIGVTVPPCEKTAHRRPLNKFLSLLIPNQAAYRREFGRDSTARFVRQGVQRSSFWFVDITWSPRHCAAAR